MRMAVSDQRKGNGHLRGRFGSRFCNSRKYRDGLCPCHLGISKSGGTCRIFAGGIYRFAEAVVEGARAVIGGTEADCKLVGIAVVKPVVARLDKKAAAVFVIRIIRIIKRMDVAQHIACGFYVHARINAADTHIGNSIVKAFKDYAD